MSDTTTTPRYKGVPSHYWAEIKTWAIQCKECGEQLVQTGVTFEGLTSGWGYGPPDPNHYGNSHVFCPACAKERGYEVLP